MKISMATDVVSPFCWMAAKQIDQAIRLFPNHKFELELRPFQVTPGLPEDYTFKQYQQEHMTQTFGNLAQVKQMLGQVTQMGKLNDCNFNLDKLKVWPNSRRAHGLWAMGETPDQQWALHKALCQAHFEHCKNLNDLQVLAQIGSQHGLDSNTIQAQLSDESYIKQILNRIASTRRQGVSSVPFLVLDEKYTVPGAKGADEIARAIRQILT